MEKSRGENKENSSSKNELYPDQYSGPVDNRCCICLDLRTGTFIVGALHLILDLSINFMWVIFFVVLDNGVVSDILSLQRFQLMFKRLIFVWKLELLSLFFIQSINIVEIYFQFFIPPCRNRIGRGLIWTFQLCWNVPIMTKMCLKSSYPVIFHLHISTIFKNWYPYLIKHIPTSRDIWIAILIALCASEKG